MTRISGESRERLDAISRALARLSGRVGHLEARVARIEARRAVPPGEGGNEAAGQGAMAERAESVFGLAWLNRAGVVTLVLGVALLFKYAVDNAWIGPRGRVAAGYVAGHGLMLGGLEVEILDQVARTAAPENAHAASVLGFSMIAAGYGLMLVCLGVWRGSRVDRVMGLAVMALVAVKVYLHDVWELGRLLRSAALVGLGLVLIAAPYLYSRHRERVARLLG